MKMYNGGLIKAGLALFLVLATFPLWYNLALGDSAARPELEMPDPAVHPNCVAPLEQMRSSHMDLLDDWRDAVVRDGERIYTADDGTKYEMSLTKTCMDCHTNKEKFCDRCHDYMDVAPYCWDCHNAPQGG